MDTGTSSANAFSSLLSITLQLNKELAVNRDTGKKHQEAPSEKLVRKFKENPFLPIGGIMKAKPKTVVKSDVDIP